MKNVLNSFLFACMAFVSTANAQLHTEENEIVCQMNDFLATRIFVESDEVLDG